MPSPKAKKPYKDYPLTPHPRGQWCKKIKGRLHYFGPLGDPDAALAKYLDERDDLQAGRVPSRSHGKPTTAGMVNAFLARCEERVKAGELAAVSFNDYVIAGRLIVEHLGRHTDPEQLRPADFARFRTAMAAQYAPSRLSKIVTVTRMMVKWAHESELIDKRPRFGPDFSIASKKAARIQKAKQGKKLVSREDIHALLQAADAKWKAIVLLCLNAGLGNSDIARVKLSDVGGEWLDMPRGKTGVERHVPLWPETQEAVQRAVRERPTPKPGSEDLLFLSQHGGPLVAVREDGKRTDLTVQGFRRLAKAADIHRPRLGLYSLRHTCATIADGAKDRVATMAILGHVDNSMTAEYVESMDDDRLRAVTVHVRQWLFAGAEEPAVTPSRRGLRIVG